MFGTQHFAANVKHVTEQRLRILDSPQPQHDAGVIAPALKRERVARAKLAFGSLKRHSEGFKRSRVIALAALRDACLV